MPLENRTYKYQYQRMESAATTDEENERSRAPPTITDPLLNHHHHASTIPINEGIKILGLHCIQSEFERQRTLTLLLLL